MQMEKSPQMKQEKKSLEWFRGSKTQLGLDPLLETMKQRQIPLTKENYLKLAYPAEMKISPEQLQEVPKILE